MVIYEVNLTVNREIFNEYYFWLVEHVKEMLQFRGFMKVEIAQEKGADEHQAAKLIVQYSVNSEDDLNDYLQNHAAKMREGSIKKFGDKFSATRRVYQTLVTI